jgi:hypothetical protein
LTLILQIYAEKFNKNLRKSVESALAAFNFWLVMNGGYKVWRNTLTSILVIEWSKLGRAAIILWAGTRPDTTVLFEKH